MSDLYEAIEYHLERARPNEFRSGSISRVSGSMVDVRIGFGVKANAITAVKPHYLPASVGDECVITRAHRTAPWVLLLAYGKDGGQNAVTKVVPEAAMGAQRYGIKHDIEGSTTVPASAPTIFAKQAVQVMGGALAIAVNANMTLTTGTGWFSVQFYVYVNSALAIQGPEDYYHNTYRPQGLTSFTTFIEYVEPGSAEIAIEAFTSGGTFTMTSLSQILEL